MWSASQCRYSWIEAQQPSPFLFRDAQNIPNDISQSRYR
jgi:hypothetical protein